MVPVVLCILLACATVSVIAEMTLPESIYRVFHGCMTGLDFKFETLPMNTDLIRSFIICCHNHTSVKSDHAQLWHTVDFGADGRDIISMSASDIQNIFELDSDLSAMLFWFISDQLTAHLPNTRAR